MISPNIAYYDRFAREYPLFFTDLAASMEREGDWLDGVLRRRGVHSVLDASCGSGRQAIPLVRRGYAVTAADPCAGMLSEAQQAAAEADVTVRFVQAAFTELPALVTDRFDAVIALGNGLCHQDRPGIVASLQAMRGCLNPGGSCVIGIKDFDRIRTERPRFHRHRSEERAEGRVVLYQIWEFQDPILLCRAFCLQEGQERTLRRAETREYMLGAGDLEAAASEAGFTTVERLPHACEAAYLLRDASNA